MLVEEQIQARQERAKEAIQKVLSRPKGQPYGDYRIHSTSGKEYRVAMRGPGLFENYCDCPDFARNTLGTCKHIESLLARLRKKHRAAVLRQGYARDRASLSLQYGESLDVRLRLPDAASLELSGIANQYFDTSGLLRREHYARFAKVMGEIRATDASAVVYSDVLEYVDRVNELADGLAWERKQLRAIETGTRALADLVKVPLFPYQLRGALFAAGRGRVVLADDMGLGKTIQAISAAELLRRRRGIRKVLVIAPASVKYQWKTEIERFSDLSVQVIDGKTRKRKRLYGEPRFFNLINYELVLNDLDLIQALEPDLIVLDEAQRIRNWETQTARSVKQLKSRYAIVLTGTPLENKLEELYSVVEFVDGRLLGPAFRFLKDHVDTDEKGKLLGYRGLHSIHERLAPVLLRRTRAEVLKQLPERTDQVFRVPMTPEQAEPYWEQSEILSRLMRKWEQQGWLSEVDTRRMMCCIQNMRMLCNSTFLFDKETNHSPKLDEFREIIRELTVEEGRKVVVFSEYERMTRLAGEVLSDLGIEFASLHGGVPTPQRGSLMQRFREDPKCMVFLSTDAGGVGLNLQAASAVINFEPPWNPARLEQRIGRVHRMGQAQPVQVVHMLTEGSIEQRVWDTMRLKRALFKGLFDSEADEVSFEKLGRKSMLKVVQELYSDEAGETLPDPAPPERDAAPPPADTPVTDDVPDATDEPADSPPSKPAPPASIDDAVAGLVEAGLRFLEAFTAPPQTQPEQSVPAQKGAAAPKQSGGSGGLFSNLVRNDPRTNRPVMAIPLPENLDAERLEQAVGGLLSRFSQRG